MDPDVLERCNTVEECYERMLAHAARGLPAPPPGGDAEIRDLLERAAGAIDGLAERYARTVRERGLEPADRHLAFLPVVERDAADALAALRLALAQPSIGSQLVDNLNASLHLRALLTDLFLLGDVLRPRPAPG